jgi:hypothetical protein
MWTKDKLLELGIIRMDSNWYGGNDYGDNLPKITKSESISMLVYQS